MLKHEITYTDFDDEKVTETLYFNLSRTELIEMDAERGEEGLANWAERLVKIKDTKTLFAEFKKIVINAYGEKSPDGKRFVKSEEIRENFANSAAFDELMVQLMTNEETVANFIKGVVPKEMAAEIEKSKAEETAKAKAVMQKALDEAPKVDIPTT